MRGTFLKCVGGVLVVLVACSNPPPPARADGSVAFDAPTDVPDGAAPDADVASLIEEDRTAPLDIPPELAPDVPPEAGPDVPPTTDAGLVVRGGIGSLGPRGMGRGGVTIVDDGFEYAGGRACAGTVCVTGGFIQ